MGRNGNCLKKRKWSREGFYTTGGGKFHGGGEKIRDLIVIILNGSRPRHFGTLYSSIKAAGNGSHYAIQVKKREKQIIRLDFCRNVKTPAFFRFSLSFPFSILSAWFLPLLSFRFN